MPYTVKEVCTRMHTTMEENEEERSCLSLDRSRSEYGMTGNVTTS